MPKFWGATKPAVQKAGGVSWWAALNYAFKLNMPVSIGMADQPTSVGAFGLSMPLSIGMAAQGISNAAFNLNMPLSIGMRTPTPLGPFNFGLSMPLSMTMQAAEQYARTFNLNMPLSIGMAGGPKSVGAFGLSMPLSIGMQGVYVPLDPQYISGTAVESTSIATMPAHTTNDLILIFAFVDGTTTAPTIPAGWTALFTGGSNSCSIACAYKWAASNAEVSGTWTGATGIMCQVYRNIMAIGNGNFIGASSATVNYGAFTFGDKDTAHNPWVVCFGAHRSTNATMNVAPAGTINRVNLEGATQDMASFDSNGPYSGTGFPSTNVTTTETASGYLTVNLELIPMTATIIQGTDLASANVPQGKSAKVTLRGGGAAGGSANKPSSGGWGAGGGGGGGYLKEVIVPPASLGSKFSMTQGYKGNPAAGNTANPGGDGTDAVFASGPTTLTAGGGKGGAAGGSGTSAGGAGGLVSGHTAFTYTEAENGGTGSNGSRTTAAATFNAASNTTHAGPGGGGGGSNSSSAYNGCAGGSSATGAGGAAGTNNGASAPGAPADAGGGGGGGNGNAGFGGTGGTGGIGGNSGAGGGGAGGKEGSTGSGGAGAAGADGYARLEFV